MVKRRLLDSTGVADRFRQTLPTADAHHQPGP
jgi:hypothetical protein